MAMATRQAGPGALRELALKKDWQSVSKTALTEIQKLISERSLGPGERIPGQRELSEQLGVSRPAIREALAMLETLGAVEVKPGQGVYLSQAGDAAPLDLEAAWHFSAQSSPQEIYQLRFAIEGFAVRMAARRAGSKDVDRLRDMNAAMQSLLENGDIVAAAAEDFAFHLAIVRLSGNRAMEQILTSLDKPILGTQMMPLSRRQRLFEPIEEHAKIIDALARGDSELAGIMMRYHITRAAERTGVVFQAG